MFQKEFAERLHDDLNSINSLINVFKIRLEFHVSKNCFSQFQD